MSLKTISERCRNAGIRMTGQRRLIIKVLENSKDHPDVETLFERSNKIDNKVSIATVYRTVKLLQNAGILEKLEFNDGRSRFEDAVRKHHDHLIDLDTGKVIEFIDEEIEHIQKKIAKKLGYDLIGHKLELYGKKNDRKN
jgi:Fur family ferric uptake transcriptional regulator